ncbi:MAG: glycosyltransferase family 4 protein [Candidatus Aminicenantes bacterium]|nr:glycosyltransferase family 4 protein [Candidatus Aminicenantes bacterium]
MTAEPVRILYLHPTAGLSGASSSLLSLFEQIDRRRFEPLLLLPEEGDFSRQARSIGVETLVLRSMVRFEEGYRLSRFPRILRSIYELAKVVKRKGIRIIHSNSPRTAYLGGTAARIAGVGSVTHVRDIHLNPFSDRRKARFLGRLSDAVVAVSSATKGAIVSVTPSLEAKTRVIYNGIDVKKMDDLPGRNVRPELGVEDDAPLIGSVGLLHPVKGPDMLIRAAARLKKSFPSLKVLLVGDVLLKQDLTYKQELEELARKEFIGDIVIFTGYREDVFDLMRAMDVLVHPAVYPDPLPRTLLEAGALRRPIVATGVGGVAEIVEHGRSGLLVEPSNPEALAEAVASLLNDRAKAAALAAEARRKVERSFSLEKHVENMTALYEEVLARRRRKSGS